MDAINTLKTEHASALKSLARERALAPRIYAELLDPAREPQPGDAEKLKGLMAVLGLTVAQVEQHAQARREAARLDELQSQVDEADAKRTEVAQKIIAEHERFRKIEREHQERDLALGVEASQWELTLNRLRRDQSRIKDLRRKHPIAFGLAEQPADDRPDGYVVRNV